MLYVRKLHTDIRQRCVEHLESHRDRSLDPFCPNELGVDGDEHLINMAKVDTYGEEYEIRAMEEIFDKVIEVRRIDEISKEVVFSSCYCYPDEVGSEEPIMLSYHNKNHYNLLSKASTSRKSEPVAYESYSSSNRILNFRHQIFKKEIDEGNPPVQKKSKLNN